MRSGLGLDRGQRSPSPAVALLTLRASLRILLWSQGGLASGPVHVFLWKSPLALVLITFKTPSWLGDFIRELEL